jgi:restriction system protein
LKFKMAEKSLFAILLRSPWWISLALAATVGVVAAALLPAEFRVIGALSGLPFAVTAAVKAAFAARRQWGRPSSAQVDRTRQAIAAMSWPVFAQALEGGFQRDGYTVRLGTRPALDFELERGGRTMVVSARRWKSARTVLEPLRALQAAREARRRRTRWSSRSERSPTALAPTQPISASWCGRQMNSRPPCAACRD